MAVHFPGGQLSPETGCVGVYDVVERRTVQKCASLEGVELKAKTLTAKGSFQCAACATAQSKRSKPAQVTDCGEPSLHVTFNPERNGCSTTGKKRTLVLYLGYRRPVEEFYPPPSLGGNMSHAKGQKTI